MERVRRCAAAFVCGLFAATAGCAGGGAGGGNESLLGARVEIVAVWDGTEAQRFEAVLERFERSTGAEVQFTSTQGEDMSVVLGSRLESSDPPALAIVPQPGLLRAYARRGYLVAIDALVGEEVRDHWSAEWERLGTVDGRMYGLWFKAAHKSLVWYDIATFERAGLVPPSDPEGFTATADALVAAGVPAFAIAGEDPWTITDWFENLYLRTAGPERYDLLAEHRLPWTDSSVVETLTLLGRLLSPPLATGTPDGVGATSFEESVELVFGRSPPAAAMVAEGDFVAGVITGSTSARLGVEADVFPFPDPDPARRLVVGGGDAVVMFTDSPASRALLRYLATREAAEVWVRLGGFVSPNEDVDLAAYPEPISRSIARSLIEAGDGFRFDLSDLQPAAFGATNGQGMFGILGDFAVAPSDAAGTAARLEASAASAYASLNPGGALGVSATLAPRNGSAARRPTPASSAGGGPSS